MNRLVKLLIVGTSACLVLFLLLGTVLGRDPKPEDVYRHFAVYTEVLSRIKSEYVEEPDMKDVTHGALNGLLESIDPYASYLTADQFKQYQKDQRTQKAGLGMILSRKVGYVSVVELAPGSPADKAGLRTGDMLETINGVSTRDMPLAYAQMLLRGKAGTKVDLSVLRVSQDTKPQELTLIRAKRKYPPVTRELLAGNVGWIRVRSLERGKSAEVAKQVRKLVKKGATRLVLDLRRCAVGDPAEGLKVANLFLNHGEMGYLVGQKVPRQDFKANPETTVTDLPMVVLINRGTAGGAEVAAAALLELKRCEVVGERSYGDAALRRAVTLADGGAVILSVAKYHSPDGKAIQDTAVTPSVVAIAHEPEQEDGAEEQPGIRPRPKRSIDQDTILQKGLEVLKKGAAQVARGTNPPARTESLTPLGVPQVAR